jgi:hypothetical protein
MAGHQPQKQITMWHCTEGLMQDDRHVTLYHVPVSINIFSGAAHIIYEVLGYCKL